MWDNLPRDLLSHIFSFLPPHSLASCLSTSKSFRSAAASTLPSSSRHHPPWLLTLPSRTHSPSILAFNPSLLRWHSLPLPSLPFPLRLLTSLPSLLLFKLVSSPSLRLLLSNPFTRQHSLLPPLHHPLRTNPAIAVLSNRIIVAGGSSAARYEQNVEMYDATQNQWQIIGLMPLEFAVRLTVWTPNESVSAGDGVTYWITSARVYSVVGFDIKSGVWREVKAPMAERLEWAGLVRRGSGRVGVVGGVENGEGFVWELREGDEWVVVADVPPLVGGGDGGVKCVGGGEVVYLFKDLRGKILVGDVRERVEWWWVDGRCDYADHKTPVKGVILYPSLSPLTILGK